MTRSGFEDGDFSTGSHPAGFPAGFVHHADLTAHGQEPIEIASASLLFSGTYVRSGFDLTIGHKFESVTIHNYFRDQALAALKTAGGASLDGHVVAALAQTADGRPLAHYAANDAAAAGPKAIGRVETVAGNATAVRNGQTVALHAGDLVYKGDAIQTDEHGKLAITFLDGTAFNLSANARMVMNDMVYEPGGTSNSSLLSLVQGSITFVAGEVAHSGDMKVDTPVATMGIRGTAVHVEIGADEGKVTFSVMREPDGRVGKYVLYDRKHPDTILGSVSDVGTDLIIQLNNGELIITQAPKSGLDLLQEQDLTALVFQTFQTGQQNPLLNALQNPQSTPQPDQSQPAKPGDHGSSGSHGSSGAPDNKLPPSTLPDPVPGALQPPAPGTHTGDPPLSPFAQGGGQTQQTVVFVIPPAASVTPVGVNETVIVAKNADFQALETLLRAAAAPNDHISMVEAGTSPAVAVASSGTTTVAGLFGHLTIAADGAFQYAADHAAALSAGQTGLDTFTYTIANAAGATSSATLSFDIDGGPVLSYGGVNVTGTSPVTDTPNLTSPEGGDQFAFTGASGATLTETGAFGTASINATTGVITYTATPGTAGTDGFTVSDTDAHGATTTATASFTTDGGPMLSYTAVAVTGTTPVTDTPSLTSPEGGDQFAFTGASGATLTETGAFGAASINATTGVITYTATPGTAGTDGFTVSDTDAHGATTTATASFTTDGGPVLSYGAVNVTGTSPVTDTPSLTSPEGGDQFAFAGASGAVLTETGAFGTASINATTGIITYTATPGTAGTDGFTVSDTDAHGATTTATASFGVSVATGPTVNTWQGPTSDSEWTVGSNWSEGAPPFQASAVIGSGATPAIDSSVTADGVTLTNGGTISVAPASSATFTLDNGTIITGGGLSIGASGGVLDIEMGANGPGATLDGVSVSNSGTISDGLTSTATFTLDDETTITGGGLSIGSSGSLDIEMGANGPGATLDGVSVSNSGTISDGLTSSATFTLDDGTTITGGALSIGSSGSLDIEMGANGPGATLDSVNVSNSGTVSDGLTSSATFTLDDGTTITGGALSIGSSGSLDIEMGASGPGATLDGVNVTNGGTVSVASGATLTLDDGTAITGGTATITGTLDANGVSLHDVSLTAAGSIAITGLTLDDGTTISGGSLAIGSGDMLAIESDPSGNSATLSGVSIMNQGTIDIGDASNATLTLDGGATVTGGTITVESETTVNSGALEIGNGASGGPGAILAGVTVNNNSGNLTIGAGMVLVLQNATINGAFNNGGTVEIMGATGPSTINISSNINGNGTIVIENGATLDIPSGDNQEVVFATGSGTLQIGRIGAFFAAIAGITGTGDILDVAGFNAATTTASTSAAGAFNGSTTTLTITDSSQPANTSTITLVGDYSGSAWTVTSDGNGGVLISDPPATTSVAVPRTSTAPMADAAMPALVAPAPASSHHEASHIEAGHTAMDNADSPFVFVETGHHRIVAATAGDPPGHSPPMDGSDAGADQGNMRFFHEVDSFMFKHDPHVEMPGAAHAADIDALLVSGSEGTLRAAGVPPVHVSAVFAAGVPFADPHATPLGYAASQDVHTHLIHL